MNDKELIATIKVSLIRGIVGMDEEALLNLIKKAIEESCEFEKAKVVAKMKVTTAIKQFQKNYEIAMKRDAVRKPISWALHKTWMWADAYEKERKK